MHTLIAFATRWGSKYGGINSFNQDFLSAFGVAYSLNAQVICIVSSASQEEIQSAWDEHRVRLIPLPYPPQEKLLTDAHAQAAIDELKRQDISFDPGQTVWLGHDLISGGIAIEAARIAGGQSALIHHMSYDQYESFAESSQAAYEKKKRQEALFKQADIVFAVGPLLRDALQDLLGGSKTIHMLIPGMAEIKPQKSPNIFTAFLSGRLSEDAERIKQGHLGIAAFAQAHREARENSMPENLISNPKLVLRGVDFEAATRRSSLGDESDVETRLKHFAEDYAQGVVNLHVLPYTQDREMLYSDLSAASVALMPSWHEGFGLVAWEAIAAGVPLIISENSGVYRLLEETHPGAGPGCVYPINIRGAGTAPYFRQEDLKDVVTALKSVANNPEKARQHASELRGMLESYTWAACAEQVMQALGWQLQKGSISIAVPEQMPSASNGEAPSLSGLPIYIPSKRWKSGIGLADSQLLRAEEAMVPFDSARQTELDALNTWLDDKQWPVAIRLITGAGGLGKTRLALELCNQRSIAGWHAGMLKTDLEPKDMSAGWQALRELNQPLLIVLDYVETRQPVLLSLIKAILQDLVTQPVRLLLLARDGGEWWDNLPGKDRECEPLLSGYATTGPYPLPALHSTEQDREPAYKQALRCYAEALDVPAPDITPKLSDEHFGRPLYLQIAALLALYGESPTSAEGLTKALLNHEKRYWRGFLLNILKEPERYCQQLLALTTLAGGFAIPRDALPYWAQAYGQNLNAAEFNSLFKALSQLYPGKQGLQAVRPDLLGEALVAHALLQPESGNLFDAVLGSSSTQVIRRNALTVLARLSSYRMDLHETMMEALVRNFAHCAQDVVAVAIETAGLMPALAEMAFNRLSPDHKSQVAGLLRPLIFEESVQLARLNCSVAGYLAEKAHKKLLKKQTNVDLLAAYAAALGNYSVTLNRIGHVQTISRSLEALKLYEQLNGINRQRFEPDYASSLDNHANRLSDVGQDDKALEHTEKALEIRERLAKKNPDRFEPDYATSLHNYANHLSDVGQDDKALEQAKKALEVRVRLAKKNPDRFEPDYAMSLNNYANRLSDVGQDDKALEYAQKALEIRERLAKKNPDRFEPDYAMSLSNHASHLSGVGQDDKALEHAKKALEIWERLTKKNPDRYEPDYAMSLSNHASHLSDVGQDDKALEHAKKALEIRERLAKKNPDRFEPDYAMSLNNYANTLSDVGENGDALNKAQQALNIRKRLAQKNPVRFSEDMFSSVCSVFFCKWLYQPSNEYSDLENLSTMPPAISQYRRPLLLLFSNFVQACLTADPAIRIEAFKQVLSCWQNLSVSYKNLARAYWLCAAAWCAVFAPEAVAELDWKASWHEFITRRHGRIPHWMKGIADRLGFQWPS